MPIVCDPCQDLLAIGANISGVNNAVNAMTESDPFSIKSESQDFIIGSFAESRFREVGITAYNSRTKSAKEMR